MSDIAIKVENLSKSYLLGHNSGQGEGYTALRDVIARNAKNFARKTRDMFQGKAIIQGDEVEEFWALKDLNFEIKQGDRVGIIGRNGAGKSTLLKVLSRITEPTTGRIAINGRVASLLEVGTGFHPELTGRENIFLNGAILGMSRREIQRKFDEIVDFAEVEKFLDTPVKRYSSGMYVRLAFAVAAHLEPEILIVDEVLAVGDAPFQRKCLGKMQDVARGAGRTVIFVSHNMASVRALCNRALFLKNGRLLLDDTTDAVAERYIADGQSTLPQSHFLPEESPSPDFHLDTVRVLDKSGAVVPALDVRDPMVVEIAYTVTAPVANLRMVLGVQTVDGVLVAHTNDPLWSTRPRHVPGSYISRCAFPAYTLNEGTFLLGVSADVPNERVLQQTGFVLPVRIEDTVGHGASGEKLPGIVRPLLEWSAALPV